MIRDNLDNLPEHSLPSGYHLRFFRKGEAKVWAEVQTRSGNFENIEKALDQFEKEFANRQDELEKRCLFLVHDESNEIIGSTIAWLESDFQGRDHGRIHWVAIVPEFQGRKLAKPMLSKAMRLLKQWHERACLGTHTLCLKAINMYLDFGFVPDMTRERAEEAWLLIAQAIDHPALEPFRRKSACDLP
ncbi:MAG: GNAT family N-acetyltransferase [Armatimonadetes bacterium]|nr:GNAT family N-acetyltransferase [Armatimonadota bacterium]